MVSRNQSGLRSIRSIKFRFDTFRFLDRFDFSPERCVDDRRRRSLLFSNHFKNFSWRANFLKCCRGGVWGGEAPLRNLRYPCLAPVPCPQFFFVQIFSSEFFRPNFFIRIFFVQFLFVRMVFVRRRSVVRPSSVRPSSVRRQSSKIQKRRQIRTPYIPSSYPLPFFKVLMPHHAVYTNT